MIDLADTSRRLVAGIGLAVLASAPALAADYKIGLFQGGTGTGSGSFTYVNAGTGVAADAVSVSDLATNASSGIGARDFDAGTLTVQVARVDFDDGKVPPNHITGFFVEGLTGTLSTSPTTGLTGCADVNSICFYRITFAFTAAVPPANPGSAIKTYTIQRMRQDNGDPVTLVHFGTYSVYNTATTIPEPGSLALVLAACAALAWRSLGRSRRDRVFAKVKSG